MDSVSVSSLKSNAIYSGGGYLDPIWLSGTTPTSTTVTLLSRRAVCDCPAGGLHSLEAAHRSGVSYSGASRIDWEVVWAAQCIARPPVPSAAPLEPSLLALSDVGGPCIRDASVEALPSERSLDGKGYRVYIQHNRPLPLRHDARTSCERSRRGQKRGGTLGIPISTTKAVFFSAKVCHL